MSEVRPCLLGCRTPDGYAFRAAPGANVCPRCSEKLRGVLDDLQHAYAAVDQLAQLTPNGQAGDGVRRVPGPKSPAVDAILVHLDPRSQDDTAALAVVESWARWVRAERSLDVAPAQMRGTVPAGRVTIRRELDSLRFNWDWIMASDQVVEFATAMRAVLAKLRQVRNDNPRVMRIGACPTPVVAMTLADGSELTLDCGASLRVRVVDTEIRCRNCGTVWAREQWPDLGDPWTDYAYLSAELDVNPSTLRFWCRDDQWTVKRVRGRTLIRRKDALASYARRRPGTYTIDQAG
ncbi:hypothetical protein [Amycolatopsis sp. CFH S0078]|uniref:hypothetical protein n=1 Tax=Amycolatopsis sp. CFH S0078 TaxID=1644108 RepID=UPI00106E297A|nr:hypothetical protein [Amycolatopsis sp. CFH S0078]